MLHLEFERDGDCGQLPFSPKGLYHTLMISGSLCLCALPNIVWASVVICYE